jgi:hypothetical protein
LQNTDKTFIQKKRAMRSYIVGRNIPVYMNLCVFVSLKS